MKNVEPLPVRTEPATSPHRTCDQCGQNIDTRNHNGRAWQIHLMRHGRQRPGTCPECDWTGTLGGLGQHRKTHRRAHTDQPATTHQPNNHDKTEPVTDDGNTLHTIIDDLLSICARLDAYTTSLYQREQDLRRFRELVNRLAQ